MRPNPMRVVRTFAVLSGLGLMFTTLVAPAMAGEEPRALDDAVDVLGVPTHLRDLGLPQELPETLRTALGRVRTEPGRLPHLQIATGDEGKRLDLPLEHTHYFADLSGFVARVDVVQTYRNPFNEAIEAIYIFPLPENSAVDDMKLKIGDRIIQAQIHKRDEAREIYDDALRSGHTAALLEQERPNVFTQSVANIPPGAEIEVILRYVQELSYDAGEYELVIPMVVGPRFIPGHPKPGRSGPGWARDTDEVPDASRITPPVIGGGARSGHDISVEVLVDPGLPVIDLDVPTHAVGIVEERLTGHHRPHRDLLRVTLDDADSIPNRDFLLRYRVDGPQPQATLLTHHDERGGFFSLVIQPPRLDIERLVGRREVIFVVDVSGSMTGVPLAQCKSAMRVALRKLRPVDTFNVITFAGRTARAFDRPHPANRTHIEQALDFIDDARAGGVTLMADAVASALSDRVEPGRHRYVIFLTDGYVGNESAIFDGAERFVRAYKRAGQRARVFAFGVGSSVNRHLINGLARAGDGVAVFATPREDPADAVNRFFRTMDHPVLEDLHIDWGRLDVRDVEPAILPDLFATQPLIVHGRYDQEGRDTLVIRGQVNGKTVLLPLEVQLSADARDRGALATLWARARIAEQERILWAGWSEDAVNAITQLGLDYRIVTEFTSFVAVDRSRTVGNGHPLRVVQPVERPEGVAASAAVLAVTKPAALAPEETKTAVRDHARAKQKAKRRARRARASDKPKAGTRGGVRAQAAQAMGFGGLGMTGSGSGGGGVGVGRGNRGGAGLGYGTGTTGRKAVVPRVVAGRAVVTGSLDRSAITRVFRKHRAELRACYERALKRGPAGLQGKIVVEVTIGPKGKVVSVKAVENTTGDAALAEALVEKIQGWRFPAPKGGGEVVVRYPMVFKDAG